MFLIGAYKPQPNSTICFKARDIKQIQSKKGNVFYEMQATIVTITNTTFNEGDEVKIWFNPNELHILKSQILKLCKSANDCEGLLFTVETDFKSNLKPFSLCSKCFVDCVNFLQKRNLGLWSVYWKFSESTIGCDDPKTIEKLVFVNLLYKLNLIDDLQINCINDLSKVSAEVIKQRMQDIHVNHKYKYNIGSIRSYHDTKKVRVYSVFYWANPDFSLGINKPFSDEEVKFIKEWQYNHFEDVNRDLYGEEIYKEIKHLTDTLNRCRGGKLI